MTGSLLPGVLYLTRNGLLEPLGQSQIFPYLKGLATRRSITLITFEKSSDWSDILSVDRMRKDCEDCGIRWLPLSFRSRPRGLAPLFGIVQLFLLALWQFHSTPRPILVHARSYAPAAVGLLLRRFMGAALIFDMRALWPEELIAANRLRRGSLLHVLLVQLERSALASSDVVVSLTHAGLEHLQLCYPRVLVQQQRLTVIPTCVDLDRFTPQPDVAPLAHGTLGTLLSGWFLLDWLRTWFVAVHSADAQASLRIHSREPEDLVRRALQLPQQQQHLLHVSALDSQAVPSAICAFKAVAMFFTPGVAKCGSSPTRLAEVLACGVPVVANDGVGDMGAVIREHRVGVLVSCATPQAMAASLVELQELRRDPDLAQRCRRTAIELFSLERGTAAYERLYRSLGA